MSSENQGSISAMLAQKNLTGVKTVAKWDVMVSWRNPVLTP